MIIALILLVVLAIYLADAFMEPLWVVPFLVFMFLLPLVDSTKEVTPIRSRSTEVWADSGKEYHFARDHNNPLGPRLIIKGHRIVQHTGYEVFKLHESNNIVLVDVSVPKILKVWTCDQIDLPTDMDPGLIRMFRKWGKSDPKIATLLRHRVDTFIE